LAASSQDAPQGTSSTRTRSTSAKTLVLLAAVALLVFALDQGAKYLVLENFKENYLVPVLGEFLQFRLVKNPGAAFSLLSGSTWIFAITASIVVVLIVVFARRIHSRGWAVVFGLLLGGTTGNLYDRLFREPGFGLGHVIDFLQLYLFPAIFNVADIAITSSMAIFIILSLRGVGIDGKRSPRRVPKPATEAAE
jgi:signal peptidase II